MVLDSQPDFQEQISKYKVCVIIPTFNNQNTLKRVIEGVLYYTNDVIIVNDGSTDDTSKILENYKDLTQIHFVKNKGKGAALREGFKIAYQNNYNYAITIDSDGQHYPNDIPVFLNELEKDDRYLLIGSRNMTHDSVPKGSSFGNKFSNFWYWAETGNRLSDTQSGYRLYPLNPLHRIKFYTNKFEFEIEVIVKAAWNGVPVKNVPIKVLYDKNERVSHFRPYKDFARISVLNTWLVLVALLYIKPRDLLIKIKNKGIKRFFVENILQNSDSPIKKSLSIALGIFIGIAPFWGFQTILALGVSAALKLNKFIAFAFSNISIPPMIPLIIWASLKMGIWILNSDTDISYEGLTNNFNVLESIKEYIVGSFTLAFISAIIFGTLGFVILKLMGKRSG
ncbi:MAG: DUF2062 domain-containing protein [Bacteroidetes bacterium]|nr:MAG: DUF2062 domain-containing protein [Bacteroidota bacterium]